MSTGWVGVDLDGTLAYYDKWDGPESIGAPIEPMVERVKLWLRQGIDVRIFTARVANLRSPELAHVEMAIEDWCRKHLGKAIPITCMKDFHLVELWDDRAIRVITNTGEPVLPPVG